MIHEHIWCDLNIQLLFQIVHFSNAALIFAHSNCLDLHIAPVHILENGMLIEC